MIFGPVRTASLFPRLRIPSGVTVPARYVLVLLLLLIPFMRGWALLNQACGELFHPEALRRVRTVCLDTSNLDARVASEVKTFMAWEDKGGRFLKQTNWELTDTCAATDVAIRVYFVPGEPCHMDQANMGNPHDTSGLSLVYCEPVNRVVLLVYDRASVRILYRKEAEGNETSNAALLKAHFPRLVKGIKELSR